MPEVEQQLAVVEVSELDARLDEVLARLRRGEVVALARRGEIIRRISARQGAGARVLGAWKGLIKISDDSADPLPEFEESV